MGALILTQEEYDLIKRQAERIYEHKNRISTREQRRKEEEYASLKAFINKLQGPGVEQGGFRRREYRTMEKLVDMTIGVLSQTIIPGYEGRIVSAKDNKEQIEHYKKYLDGAVKNLNTYVNMKNKLQGVL